MGLFDTLKSFGSSVLSGLKSAYDWATGSSPIAQGLKSVASWASSSGIPIISTIGRGYEALTSQGVGQALTSAQQALGSGNPADAYNAGKTLFSTAKNIFNDVRRQ